MRSVRVRFIRRGAGALRGGPARVAKTPGRPVGATERTLAGDRIAERVASGGGGRCAAASPSTAQQQRESRRTDDCRGQADEPALARPGLAPQHLLYEAFA